MVTAINTQVNFTKGEIDERLYSRIDTDIYAKSVKRMRNALITPQGGVQRRFGTKYIAEAGDSDSRTFVIHITKGGNPSETILLEFILNQLKVYINDTLYTAFVTPYGSESLEILDGTQSTDDFVIVDGIHLPHRFYYKYIDGTDAYVFEEIDFIWQPTYNFNRNDNLYDTVTFTPSATSGTVTIVASDHVMDATMVGGLFYGGEGTLRITTYIDTLSVSGFTIEDFKNTTPIDGRNVVINTPVWAGDYWPSKVTFEQDRLCFANSGRLPNGVWCSKTGEYNNFDDSKSLDNFSIGFYINGEGNDAVNSLIGYKGLIIFTNNAIFTTSFVEGEPLTPSNISVNSEGEVGSAEFIRPIIYDNKIFFCGYGNNIIWSMQYDIQRRGYVYSDISILSPHLVKGVKRMSMYKNAADDIGSCLLVINEDNDCAILKSIESQNISGWSLCQTSGDFYDVAGYEDIVYFNTYRNTNYLIEKLDFSLFTDSAVAGTMASSDVITGLDHLNGLEVKVIGV